jgi:hypothetical protein
MKLVVKAIFQSARTTIDGGWRVSFDLSEQESEFISKLPSLKGKELFVVVMERENEDRATVSTDFSEQGLCDGFQDPETI